MENHKHYNRVKNNKNNELIIIIIVLRFMYCAKNMFGIIYRKGVFKDLFCPLEYCLYMVGVSVVVVSIF